MELLTNSGFSHKIYLTYFENEQNDLGCFVANDLSQEMPSFVSIKTLTKRSCEPIRKLFYNSKQQFKVTLFRSSHEFC